MRLSIQKSVIFIIVILLSGGLSGGIFFHSLYSDVREKVASTRSDEAAKRIREKFMDLATPIQRDLALLSQWGKSGQLDMDDIPSLNNRLIPLIESQPYVLSLILADTEGREYFLFKDDDGWMIRHSEAFRPDMTVTIDQLDKSGLKKESTQSPRTFDPRTRGWFAGALQSKSDGSIYWTEPYTFKTLGEMGITASIKWQVDNGEGSIIVAAMDVSLAMLHRFLSEIKISPGSQIILIRNDGMVLTTDPSKGHAFADFTGHSGLPNGLKKDALTLWSDLKKSQSYTHSFTSQGKSWWASFHPMQPESPKSWFGVLIPESDLISQLDNWWLPYSLKFGGILIVFFLLTGLIVWHYGPGHRKDNDPAPLNKESLKKLIQSGESSTLEFKSTVRTNLKSGKKDKAIELAWLKSVTAFMNTDGGTLLIGVSDDGSICGITADEFENDDKCHLHVKNLIHEHIGSEFAGLIHCRLLSIDDLTVASLVCRKSEAPVFLKVGKNEDFFVRSGPSSTKLSMSRMVTYLEQRK